MRRRQLGTTGIQVSELGFGGSQIGGMFAPVTDDAAHRALQVAWHHGTDYFDTAPFYGRGASEHRVGRFLRSVPRDSFVISTKVGRVLTRPSDPTSFCSPDAVDGLPFEFRFDYGYDGVMRSYEDSLQRLGLNRVDVLFIHDLDVTQHGSLEAVERHFEALEAGGGWRALAELRAAGEVRAIGAGINVTGMIPRLLAAFDLDVFLVAMPYTLLDQDALAAELPLCVERGAGVVIGAPFSSGILAAGRGENAPYRYAPAPAAVREKALRIAAVCARHNVPMRAAALQLPLLHPAVASVIPGVISSEQVEDNLAMRQVPIASQYWADLKAEGLLAPGTPVG
jgi:D-threo-aldose 1-dehydrogenase